MDRNRRRKERILYNKVYKVIHQMLSISKIYSPFPEYKGGHHSKTSSPKSSLSSDENMSMVEASSWDGCLGSNVSTPGMPIELCISEVGAWASVDWP